MSVFSDVKSALMDELQALTPPSSYTIQVSGYPGATLDMLKKGTVGFALEVTRNGTMEEYRSNVKRDRTFDFMIEVNMSWDQTLSGQEGEDQESAFDQMIEDICSKYRQNPYIGGRLAKAGLVLVQSDEAGFRTYEGDAVMRYRMLLLPATVTVV